MRIKAFHIFVFASLVCSCKFKKASFSVEAPKNWIVIDSVKNDNSKYVKMYSPAPNVDSLPQDNINIGVMHYSTVDAYIKAVYSKIEDESRYFKEKGNGDVIINNRKVKWKEYLLQINNKTVLAEQKVYFIVYKENIFQIVCTSKPNGIKDMQMKIDTVLNSFKIL